MLQDETVQYTAASMQICLYPGKNLSAGFHYAKSCNNRYTHCPGKKTEPLHVTLANCWTQTMLNK